MDDFQQQNDWKVNDSAELYGIREWGAGYFDLNAEGNAAVTVEINGETVSVALMDIVQGMKDRGLEMPCVLRIENLLDSRISQLNEAFAAAITSVGYNNHYRGVFPIKVNQQCHVIEEIARFGSRYNHGLEAGSKAELIIALSQLTDHDSLIICNGYKDTEFIELGLYARQIGIRCFFVLETPSELPIIIERSKALGIEPLIGIRLRLSTTVDGHWKDDSGDRSIFGLSTSALLDVVDELKKHNMLHCLQLLHSHLGSQIPNIRNVRTGVAEVCRFYSGLVKEGAPMGYLDLGGGLAVDYEGSSSNSTHSMNYQLDEYCVNIVETVAESLNGEGLAHPVLISESGRATVAYSSMLLFNILDVRDKTPAPIPTSIDKNSPEVLHNLLSLQGKTNVDNFQECYNDAIYYRDEVRELFHRGLATLRERALAENINLSVLADIAKLLPDVARIPSELENLPELLSDIYYGNFSLFQSLPDVWAIDQLFPVMPIHRHDEKPTRQGIIADITCDCDGKIDKFALPSGHANTLPLHPINKDEEYYMGVFLVGAYQETLGDLHNLFGDTNVVSVKIEADGGYHFQREFEGDSISDVLSYVEYNPMTMQEQFRKKAETAVREGTITVTRRKEMMKAFRESMQGYTYFER